MDRLKRVIRSLAKARNVQSITASKPTNAPIRGSLREKYGSGPHAKQNNTRQQKNLVRNAASKIFVTLPLPQDRIIAAHKAFDTSEKGLRVVHANLKKMKLSRMVAQTPGALDEISTFIAEVDDFVRALQRQRDIWTRAMADPRLRQMQMKKRLSNWPVTPLSTATNDNRFQYTRSNLPGHTFNFRVHNFERSLARSVRDALGKMGVFERVLMKKNNHMKTPSNTQSSSPIRSPPQTPTMTNARPSKNTVSIGNNVQLLRKRHNKNFAPNAPNVLEKRNNKSVVVTVPLSAAEKTVVVARFKDARHLIKTVLINMPRDANVVAKYGSKKDVAHHQELLDTVRRYDRALKTQRTAWKPYLGSVSGGNTKRVTLPNWPVTAFSSVLVKNRRYVTNTREVGLAPNVQRTLTNTGQVVNTVIRTLTPTFVWIALPLDQASVRQARQAFEQLADYIVLLKHQLEKLSFTDNGRYARSLPKWEQSQLHHGAYTIDRIDENFRSQIRDWADLWSLSNAPKIRVEMPNWPVTPLSKINVGNAKNPIPAAAPDVQLQLRAFEMLLQRHHRATNGRYDTLKNNNINIVHGNSKAKLKHNMTVERAEIRRNLIQQNKLNRLNENAMRTLKLPKGNEPNRSFYLYSVSKNV